MPAVIDGPLVVLPNIEALVSSFLRDQPEVAQLVNARVYTSIPKAATYPLARVTQITDSKQTSEPLWISETLVQVEAYGGTKAQASTLARVCEGVLAARIRGTYLIENAVVNGFTGGGMQDIPDDEYEPAKNRFLFVCTLISHPLLTADSVDPPIPPPIDGLDGGDADTVHDDTVDGGNAFDSIPDDIYDGGNA